MSGFLFAPVFLPYQQPLENGADGDVLTIVGGQRAWAPASGGGVKQGYLGTYLSAAPAAGSYTLYDPAGFGPGVGRLDIDTSGGNVTLVSLTPGSDGQLLNVSNIGANELILDVPGFRLPGQMYIPKFDAQLLCYYAGSVNQWVMA